MNRQYDWKEFIRQIQDNLFLSQEEFARQLGVSQQAISAWANGSRNPGQKVRRDMLEFATRHGMKAERHLIDPALLALKKFLKKHKDRNFAKIVAFLAQMSDADKKKFFRYAKKVANMS